MHAMATIVILGWPEMHVKSCGIQKIEEESGGQLARLDLLHFVHMYL